MNVGHEFTVSLNGHNTIPVWQRSRVVNAGDHSDPWKERRLEPGTAKGLANRIFKAFFLVPGGGIPVFLYSEGVIVVDAEAMVASMITVEVERGQVHEAS